MQSRFINLKHYFLRDINPAIRFLILSDIAIVGSAAMLGPVFALFIDGFIEGGNAAVAGVAAGVYLISKSVLQIPIFYLIISTPFELYIVQFFFGLFTAFTFPSFMALFTRHIDKNKEGMEWGIYFTFTDMVGALLSMLRDILRQSMVFKF